MRTSLGIATLAFPVVLAATGIGNGSTAETVTAPATTVDTTPVATTAPVISTTTVAPTTPAVTPTPVVDGIRTSLAPHVRVIGANTAQRAALDEALGRFRRERLTLPDLDIRFFDDEADCQGHLGLFTSAVMPWRVSICTDLPFVLTHEFAHAWTAANLDDADRDAYLAERGLAAWRGQELEWNERGVEDAAFMIQQNLMAGAVRVDSPTWTERMSAYEQLTGKPSPLRRSETDGVTAGVVVPPWRSLG